jgi:hypothetical protein
MIFRVLFSQGGGLLGFAGARNGRRLSGIARPNLHVLAPSKFTPPLPAKAFQHLVVGCKPADLRQKW